MMRNVLNIIDKIYSSEYFTTILIIAIIVLLVLFALVFIMGMIDNKKEELKKQKELSEEQDITFNEIKEEDKDLAKEAAENCPTGAIEIEE